MTEGQLDQHVKILGWLNIIGAALFIVIGAFVFLLLVGVGAASGDVEAVPVLTLIATIVGGFMLVMALPGLAAGYGLLKRRSWGRILGLVVGVLNIPNFPLGTIIGVYSLWVLLQEEATAYFGRPKVA